MTLRPDVSLAIPDGATEETLRREIAFLKADIIDIEVQLSERRRPGPGIADPWADWRDRARKAHALKRKRLIVLKAHLATLDEARRRAFRECQDDYDPSSPHDLVVVATDVIQRQLAALAALGSPPDDDALSVVADLRAYLSAPTGVPA